jgi:hypothetical protein
MRDAQVFNISLVISPQPDDFLGLGNILYFLPQLQWLGLFLYRGKFQGSESFIIEKASPFCICWIFNFFSNCYKVIIEDIGHVFYIL